MVRYLRTNTRLTGEITPQRAARILEVHRETVYRWCQEAIEGRGPMKGAVRQSVTGWYYIDSKAVKILAERGKPAPPLG